MAAETYDCEVVTFTADLGQGEERAGPRRPRCSASRKYVEEREELRDFVMPMFRANALYEGCYLLGTSIARPQSPNARSKSPPRPATTRCRRATGKGNDQVRFELACYALQPGIKIIAPWREWDLASRTQLIDYAEKHQIPIPHDKRGEAPFSVDANLLHSSSEGKVLEDPSVAPGEYVFQRTVSPEAAPDRATEVEIGFRTGDPVSVDGVDLSPAALLTRRTIGPGQRYRPPGSGRKPLCRHEEPRRLRDARRHHWHVAHRAESPTLDRGMAHLKDEMMPRYAELIYNGFYLPEREMMRAIDYSQRHVPARCV